MNFELQNNSLFFCFYFYGMLLTFEIKTLVKKMRLTIFKFFFTTVRTINFNYL